MKNSTLNPRDCNYIVGESGFRVGFSRANRSSDFLSLLKNKKSKIPSYSMLILFFLFTNFLFAQQPACNLTGKLESKLATEGGQNVTINSEVVGSVPGTIYRWEFKSNDSGASFVSANGRPSITVNPGNKNGSFNVKLTLINPSDTRRSGKSCSCTKSVSTGDL